MADEPLNIVFIIGSGRCGSSLVHEIVARHQDVAFISNIEDNLGPLNLKGRFNNSMFRSVLGNFTRKGTLRFAPSEGYQLAARQVSPIYAKSTRNLRSSDVTPWLRKRFREFFETRAAAQQKPVFVHKYTGWSRMGFFREIFPEAKFVHVIRDGRAVANSFLQMDWWDGYQGPENWLYGQLSPEHMAEWTASGRSFVTLAGIAWKLLVDSIEEDASDLDGSSYKRVRYEDFLDQPETVMAEILDFAGLRWSEDFQKRLQGIGITSSRREAYREDLTAAQLEELEACLAITLRRFDYT